uniref:50S ribosomal protein L13 n=1 Tax=Anthurium amnicola TaxID=1678845 RepID=A0A1D1YDV8_9ARAE
MTLASPKSISGFLPLPRTLSSLLISVAGLALFLIVASRFLISYPISSTIHEYIVGVDHSRGTALFNTNGTVVPQNNQKGVPVNESATGFEPSDNPASINSSYLGERQGAEDEKKKSSENGTNTTKIDEPSFPGGTQEENPGKNYISQNATEGLQIDSSKSAKGSSVVRSKAFDSASTSVDSTATVAPPSQLLTNYSKKIDSGSCDLYRGRWVYDTAGPLYTNNTCPVITQMQNCQGNGRPDKDYEKWRWKPDQCNLPRFDAKKFLQLMRGKTLAFVGDSVARNQMESMLCILWQVETPRNRGNRRMQRWYFKSTSTTIVRIWSSWLVRHTNGPIQFAPEGIDKLHLDAPDESFMEYLPMFDVVVLSSGHWFAKQSVYVLNDTIVGWQLWWPDKSQKMVVNNIDAYGISVETVLTAIAKHPKYTGFTIVRSFSPDHYEGGAWNTGGSCTGQVMPTTEVVRNGFTDAMHGKQVKGFERAVKNTQDGSKLRFMDITEVFAYRHDGHPGPYRSRDPNKVIQRGPNGKPPPQDCLHWCMPGPVDTWNELVLEIIRREFEVEES